MSDLIPKNNSTHIRWKLLTSASALALTIYITSAPSARAEDSDRPPVWIELGGQLEQMQGLSGEPFTAPFMLIEPTPVPYQGISMDGIQRPSRFDLGWEGNISVQPKDSDWKFSVGVRYGRSNRSRHIHQQTSGIFAPIYSATPPPHEQIGTYQFIRSAFFDSQVKSSEHHMVLDFSVGRDVGIGILGRDGSSTVSGGVRYFELGESFSGSFFARPNVTAWYQAPKYNFPNPMFHDYKMMAHAKRSFTGIGPSLSWNASAALLGNQEDGELMLDWSINGALLFGRQKAKTDHSTGALDRKLQGAGGTTVPLYPSRNYDAPQRSRRITVPNLGGTLGVSVKYPNFKFSLGYRADFFFGAVDTGIDARQTRSLGYNGPYASVSIGLGG